MTKHTATPLAAVCCGCLQTIQGATCLVFDGLADDPHDETRRCFCDESCHRRWVRRDDWDWDTEC